MVAVSSKVREGLRFAATPDVMPLHEATALARMLSRYAPTDDAERVLAERAGEARAGQAFLDAFGIVDARKWNPTQSWGQVTPAERLRVPIGTKLNGELAYLDIKESAENGMGPHGHMIGCTGSGKSEHCLALVLGLAAKFPPEMVQILLGDFKGESAFAGLERLPHVVGVVSNLEKSQHKLDRFELVLRGELNRRQELLSKAGFPQGVREYEAARAAGRNDLEPIGALILVLDEFTQLLQLRPGMIKVMDEVARLGRSLWVHIINASQRAETAKMSGMIAQQGFAIGLKVTNASESRAAIGSPRAWEEFKNAAPGSAFLVVDDEHVRYRAFYVSGPFVPPKLKGAQRDRAEGYYLGVSKFTAEVVALPDTVEEDVEDDEYIEDVVPGADAPKLSRVLIDRIRAAGDARPRHRLWLPAFEEIGVIPIDEVVEEFWGRPWGEVSRDAGLVVPYGREDDALRHSQDVVSVRLDDSNLGVAGAPQTGKSTAIRTVMLALAMSHSPQRVQFYGIDCGGGKLQSVAGLPHVCGIAAQGDVEKMRRVVSEVERIVATRQRTWANWDENGLNLVEFRARKFGQSPGEVPEDGHGDVFLIVDNINALKADSEDTALLGIHDRVTTLANGSLNFGVHVIISNDQWLTIKCEPKLSAKIELRMADSSDTKMRNRDAAKQVPDTQKGRGLVMDGNHLLVAAPYLRQCAEEPNEMAATEATTKAIAKRWQELGFDPAPKLQQLPAEIYYGDPRLPAAGRHVLKLGMGERQMATVGLDLRETPHMYCVGSHDSGRSVFLRTVCEAIKDSYTPEEAQVIQIDPNFSLADSLDERYRKVYANTQHDISVAAQAIAERLEARQPKGMSPAELANWKPVRPKWFILVDDLHLCTPVGSTQSLLQPLARAIATSRHLDLHVIVTCEVAGWYAMSQNKIIGAMDGAGAGVLVLDGDKREKIIADVRPASRNPGRGELWRRKGGGQLIQVALPTGWTKPADEDHV